MQMEGAVLGHSLVAGLLGHLSYRRRHARLGDQSVARLIGERGVAAIGYSGY